MKNKEIKDKFELVWVAVILIMFFIVIILILIFPEGKNHKIDFERSNCTKVGETFCKCIVDGKSMDCDYRDYLISGDYHGKKPHATSKSCSEKVSGYLCSEVFVNGK